MSPLRLHNPEIIDFHPPLSRLVPRSFPLGSDDAAFEDYDALLLRWRTSLL